MNPMRLKIAIVDDHQLVVDGLVAWLRENAPHTAVSYAGGDPAEPLERAGELDVVLLDLELADGMPAASDTVARFTEVDTPVLLVSAVGDHKPIREALLAGALGYLPKSSPSSALLEAMYVVASGNSFVSADLAAVMAEDEPGTLAPDLSPRELRALRLYASGLKMDSVARRMGISPHTAKEYIDRVRAKYAVAGRVARSKLDLISAANDDGLIDPDGSEA